MTSGASRGEIERRYRRTSICDTLDTMSPVTVAAGRNPIFALCHLLTVRAGQVLRELIDPNLRIVLTHEARIAVALGAQRGNLRAWGP
jgi:hypothetical protein